MHDRLEKYRHDNPQGKKSEDSNEDEVSSRFPVRFEFAEPFRFTEHAAVPVKTAIAASRRIVVFSNMRAMPASPHGSDCIIAFGR